LYLSTSFFFLWLKIVVHELRSCSGKKNTKKRGGRKRGREELKMKSHIPQVLNKFSLFWYIKFTTLIENWVHRILALCLIAAFISAQYSNKLPSQHLLTTSLDTKPSSSLAIRPQLDKLTNHTTMWSLENWSEMTSQMDQMHFCFLPSCSISLQVSACRVLSEHTC